MEHSISKASYKSLHKLAITIFEITQTFFNPDKAELFEGSFFLG